MPIVKVTHNTLYRRANVHSQGCNFNCEWCSYKLKNGKQTTRFIDDTEVKKALKDLDIDRVHFIGGEPTIYPGLGELAKFAHEELGVVTKLGHSNGANVPPDHIDEANISIKTLRDDVHLRNCGIPSAVVRQNFRKAHENGVRVDASSVLIPGLIEIDEIAGIAEFVSTIDDSIPYHIIGYIPVPGAPWRRPTCQEVELARKEAMKFLRTVTMSCLSEQEWNGDPAERDPRYTNLRVA